MGLELSQAFFHWGGDFTRENFFMVEFSGEKLSIGGGIPAEKFSRRGGFSAWSKKRSK